MSVSLEVSTWSDIAKGAKSVLRDEGLEIDNSGTCGLLISGVDHYSFKS